MDKKEMHTISDTIGNTMQMVLGEDFTVLTNVPLAHLAYNIPLQIIGPTGIWLVDIVTDKGMFCYRDENLYQVIPGKRIPRYKKTKHSKRLQEMLNAISLVLGSTEKTPKGVYPALLFVAPESSVKRDISPIPLIRLIDLTYFCENISKRNQIFDKDMLSLILGRFVPQEPESILDAVNEDELMSE